MIINEKIKIRINRFNIKHYKSMGHNIHINDIIDVNPIDLMITSKAIVKVECDNCRTKENIEYRKYLTKKYNHGYFCRICKRTINDIIFRNFNKTLNYIPITNDVYTKNGWVNLNNINPYDLVLVHNGSNLSFSPIKSIKEKEVDYYYNIKSNYINFSFTENHSFLLKDRYNKLEIKSYKETNNKNYMFSNIDITNEQKLDFFVLSEYMIDMTLWCKFMGIYLMTGYFNSNNICLFVKDKQIFELRTILNEMPFIYNEISNKDGSEFIIRDILLYEYLNKNKYITPELKNTNTHNINLFLDYFNQNKLYREYYTTSEELKDGLEFLFYKIGKSCNINTQTGKKPLWVISETNKNGRYLDKRFITLSKVDEKIKSIFIETKIDGYILIRSNDNCVFYSI